MMGQLQVKRNLLLSESMQPEEMGPMWEGDHNAGLWGLGITSHSQYPQTFA